MTERVVVVRQPTLVQVVRESMGVRVAAPGPQGPPGPQGSPGPPGLPGGGGHEHPQVIPQSVWIVVHEMGRYPIAWSLFDTAGRLCEEYSVEHLDVNTCRVSMDTPTAGVIRLI